MRVVTMTVHISGAAAVREARYASVMVVFAQTAVVAMGTGAYDVVAATAAIPPVITIIVGSAADINRVVAVGQCGESGTARVIVAALIVGVHTRAE